MGIKKIGLEIKDGEIEVYLEGDYCTLHVSSKKIVQISDSEQILTITTQALPVLPNPIVHDEYLVSQDELKLSIPDELRSSKPKVNNT